MTTYNPYTSQQRHRRARVRQGMPLWEFLGCIGVTVVTILLMYAAAML